jgi:hypothetical protein
VLTALLKVAALEHPSVQVAHVLHVPGVVSGLTSAGGREDQHGGTVSPVVMRPLLLRVSG